MSIKVSRNSFTGKGRIITDIDFETVELAQKYADETNFYYYGADARVEVV